MPKLMAMAMAIHPKLVSYFTKILEYKTYCKVRVIEKIQIKKHIISLKKNIIIRCQQNNEMIIIEYFSIRYMHRFSSRVRTRSFIHGVSVLSWLWHSNIGNTHLSTYVVNTQPLAIQTCWAISIRCTFNKLYNN